MDALTARAGGHCELCSASDALAAHPIDAGVEEADRSVLLCEGCRGPILAGGLLEGTRWYCLQESIWSEVGAVQVLSYRLLHRMGGASWATDLLGQAYLEEELLAWAKAGLEQGEGGPAVVDCNGAPLSDGDSVTLIKDLAVKGAGFTAKRGTLVKNIRLGDDPTHVEGRVNKMSIMLKTCFLKRAG